MQFFGNCKSSIFRLLDFKIQPGKSSEQVEPVSSDEESDVQSDTTPTKARNRMSMFYNTGVKRPQPASLNVSDTASDLQHLHIYSPEAAYSRIASQQPTPEVGREAPARGTPRAGDTSAVRFTDSTSPGSSSGSDKSLTPPKLVMSSDDSSPTHEMTSPPRKRSGEHLREPLVVTSDGEDLNVVDEDSRPPITPFPSLTNSQDKTPAEPLKQTPTDWMKQLNASQQRPVQEESTPQKTRNANPGPVVIAPLPQKKKEDGGPANKKEAATGKPKTTRRRQKKWLTCTTCDKRFDRPSLLERHNRTHTGEKASQCSLTDRRDFVSFVHVCNGTSCLCR